ncbi:hypothetical protein like AT2G03955 [Hibiscus trionum]|uniref:Defensin-like domain-containing protein n=1 Tax=Hibiscus trionum TaxID=183268 RepID=A0A9W7LJS7_HIBTR|nr:hypothetical protein like AT2G03955 [Hibiscus trionum]
MTAVLEKSILSLLFVLIFICSSVRSDVEMNVVRVNSGPSCFKMCSASYGDYECNVDCIDKKFSGGRCVPSGAQRRCCCPA